MLPPMYIVLGHSVIQQLNHARYHTVEGWLVLHTHINTRPLGYVLIEIAQLLM